MVDPDITDELVCKEMGACFDNRSPIKVFYFNDWVYNKARLSKKAKYETLRRVQVGRDAFDRACQNKCFPLLLVKYVNVCSLLCRKSHEYCYKTYRSRKVGGKPKPG